jgi:hypothetical protein
LASGRPRAHNLVKLAAEYQAQTGNEVIVEEIAAKHITIS